MYRWLWIVVFCLAWTGSAQADSFKTLAGVELGTDIANYWHLLYKDTATEHPDVLFMREARIKPGAIPGIRGGSLSYTACREEQLVARMKLKFVQHGGSLFRDLFEDPEKALFDELLQMYRDRLGRPDEWLGNAFNTVQAWQWTLGKDQPEQVEIILMYSKVEDLRPGVSIKMTLTSLWEEERACWELTRDREHVDEEYGVMEIRRLEDFVPH